MFESAVIAELKNDAGLVSCVSVFNGSPAIFADAAPETSVLPYVVIRIDRIETIGIIQTFNMYVDYYDYNVSRVKQDTAIERIEFLLDDMILTSERYSEIRLTLSGGSPIEGTDAREIHYNLQFYARATRAKWGTIQPIYGGA